MLPYGSYVNLCWAHGMAVFHLSHILFKHIKLDLGSLGLGLGRALIFVGALRFWINSDQNSKQGVIKECRTVFQIFKA